jgi:UDP-N-acetyl-D-galactosamine dehydrogenase
MVLAVNHAAYLAEGEALAKRVKPDGVLIDVKSALDPSDLPDGLVYWSL